jgi:hypothetical protein
MIVSPLGEKLLFLSKNVGFLTTTYFYKNSAEIRLPVFLPHNFSFGHIQVLWLKFLPPGSSDSARRSQRGLFSLGGWALGERTPPPPPPIHPYSAREGYWKWWALKLLYIKLPMYLFFLYGALTLIVKSL